MTFHAGLTADTREVLNAIHARYAKTSQIIAVGFSMGANILCKYLGEEGKNAKVMMHANRNPCEGNTHELRSVRLMAQCCSPTLGISTQVCFSTIELFLLLPANAHVRRQLANNCHKAAAVCTVSFSSMR